MANSADARADERTALLTEPTAARDQAALDDTQQNNTLARRVFTLTLNLAIMLAVELGGTLATTPLLQVQEGIVCREHHTNVTQPTTDPRCKDSVVQADFAMLQGWEATFALIPGLLLSIPYGMASDKYGRRIILFLSILGIALVETAVIIICK